MFYIKIFKYNGATAVKRAEKGEITECKSEQGLICAEFIMPLCNINYCGLKILFIIKSLKLHKSIAH